MLFVCMHNSFNFCAPSALVGGMDSQELRSMGKVYKSWDEALSKFLCGRHRRDHPLPTSKCCNSAAKLAMLKWDVGNSLAFNVHSLRLYFRTHMHFAKCIWSLFITA